MLKKSLTAVIIGSLTMAAFAEQGYHTEVAAEVSRESLDDGFLWSDGKRDQTFYATGIRYHFKEVNTDQTAYAEAAFLQRSSSVTAAYFTSEKDIDEGIMGASIEYYVPNTFLFLGASASRLTGGRGDTNWSATVGVAPIDGLLVTTTFDDDDDYDPNLDAKYVTALGGDRYIGVRGSYYHGEFNDSYGIGGDYFFTKATNVGLDFGFSDVDGDEVATTVSVRHFFAPQFSVGASYTNDDYSNTAAVNASYRF